VDVPLEFGSSKRVEVVLQAHPGLRTGTVEFAPTLGTVSFAGQLGVYVRGGSGPSVYAPLDFGPDTTPSVELPTGDYKATPSGVGPSAMWWGRAGETVEFRVEAGRSVRVPLLLRGVRVSIDLRDRGGQPIYDFGLGVSPADMPAVQHVHDWGAAAFLRSSESSAKPTLWLPIGSFDVEFVRGARVVGRGRVQEAESGTMVELEIVDADG
jgi:hypothetical protein